MKKESDPLWDIVGEDVRLQGSEKTLRLTCPRCGVGVELPGDAETGYRFRCGLCGALSEIGPGSLISDDGSAELITRLAE